MPGWTFWSSSRHSSPMSSPSRSKSVAMMTRSNSRLEGRDDSTLRHPLQRPRLEQLRKSRERPLRELLGVVELHDVTAQADDRVRSFGTVEPKDVRPLETGASHAPVGQNDGDPERGVELLRDDECANHGSIIRPRAVDKIRGRLTAIERSERERARSTGGEPG